MLQPPFDLHVLSTPPAFILSQDQTLRKIVTFSGVVYGVYERQSISSYHSSIVKVPFPRAGFYSLAPLLSRSLRDKTADVFLNFPVNIGHSMRSPCASGFKGLVCLDPLFQRIVLRTKILPLSPALSRVFRHKIRRCFHFNTGSLCLGDPIWVPSSSWSIRL